jgi:hypothetical protein
MQWKILAYVFYEHLEYFTAIWYNLWPFGIVCVHLVHFSGFGSMHQEKSGNPDLGEVFCTLRFSCLGGNSPSRQTLQTTPSTRFFVHLEKSLL